MTTNELSSFETITWPNHAAKSFKYLYEFYASQALCDVTLIAQDGTTFKAHQILLAVHSSFFHWVFHGWRQTDERVTEFKTDIEAEVLEALLCLIYQGEVRVPVHGPWRHKILEVACTLQFSGVVDLLAGVQGMGVSVTGGGRNTGFGVGTGVGENAGFGVSTVDGGYTGVTVNTKGGGKEGVGIDTGGGGNAGFGVSTGGGGNIEMGAKKGGEGTNNGDGRDICADDVVGSSVKECSMNEEVRPGSLHEQNRQFSVSDKGKTCDLNEEVRLQTLTKEVNEEVRPHSFEEGRPCSVSGEAKFCSKNVGRPVVLSELDRLIHKEDGRLTSVNEGSSYSSSVTATETSYFVNEEDRPCQMNEDASPQVSNSKEVRNPMIEEGCFEYSNEEARQDYSHKEGTSYHYEHKQCDQTEISRYIELQSEHLADRQRAEIASGIQSAKKESQYTDFNLQEQTKMTCIKTTRVPYVHDGCSETGDMDTSQISHHPIISNFASQTRNDKDFDKLPSKMASSSLPGGIDHDLPDPSASQSTERFIDIDFKFSSISSNALCQKDDLSNKNVQMSKVKGKRSRKGIMKEKSSGSLKCTECGSMFSLRKTLKFHLMQVHSLTVEQVKCNPELLIQCEVKGCHFASTDYVEVERHAKSLHPSVKHTCYECVRPRTFHLAAMLERHLSKVHGAPETHRCSECGENFSKRVYLLEHERDTHGVQHSVKLFRCEVADCGYETVREVLLQKHRQVGHQQHKCPHCNTVVKTSNTLQTHIRTMHLHIRPYLCDVCGAGFSKEPILRQHVKTKHSDSKEFTCQLCPYATNIHWYLANHVFHRHGIRANFDRRKEIKCPDCSLKFLTKSYLQKHIRNVHDDTSKWTCDVCGKTYKSFSAMSTHRKVHQDTETKCPHCEYSSKTGEHMKLHIRTQHTFKGMKPYSCPYCSYCSAMGGNVRKHVMQKHPGEEVRYDTNKEQILHMQVVEAQMMKGGGSSGVDLKSNTLTS